MSIEERWAEFKSTHDKTYDEEEDARRFEIFKKNVEEIDEHNRKFEAGEVTFSKAINTFTDQAPEETKTRSTGLLGSR